MRFHRLACLFVPFLVSITALPSKTTYQSSCEDLQDDVPDDDPINTRMVGDLTTPTTPVGSSIANILLRKESAESCEGNYHPPGLPKTKACQADSCKPWLFP
jgi:hypothetical protein